MIQPIGQWKQIFAPYELSKYVNDHTIFVDGDGKYRLLGTFSDKDYAPHRETAFIEAISEKLDGPYIENKITFKNDPHPGIKIAPFVIYSEKDSKYHLFFGPGKISHYVSSTGDDWEYVGVAIKTIWPLTRDPNIIFDRDEYIMYLTGSNNRILAYVSSDLNHWEYKGSVFRLNFGTPRSLNSACESPAVIKYGEYYYLFTTVTPALIGAKANYNNTLVFRSKNPLDFGSCSDVTRDFFGQIEAHAPEIFQIKDKIFYTSCGWSHMPKPAGIDNDGVYMRELKIS